MLLNCLDRSRAPTRLPTMRHRSTMIENVRKMMDLIWLEPLGETQQEIVAVCSSKTVTKAKRLS